MASTYQPDPQWHISVHDAFGIFVHYLELEMDLSEGCQYTHLSVSSEDKLQFPKPVIFCGTHSPWDEAYQTNSIWFRLHLRY